MKKISKENNRECILNLMGLELSKEDSSLDKNSETNKGEDKKPIINTDLSQQVKIYKKEDLNLYNDLNKENVNDESKETKESSSEKIDLENNVKKNPMKDHWENAEGNEINKKHDLKKIYDGSNNLKKINLINLDEISEKYIENKGDNSFIFNGKIFKKDKHLNDYIKKNNIIREV